MLGTKKQNKILAFILDVFLAPDFLQNPDFFRKKCGSTEVYLFMLASQSEIIFVC